MPEGADRHREVETKLDADAEFRMPSLDGDPRLAAAGIKSVDDGGRIPLRAVYYDTEGLDLLGSRLTLRRRTGGADAGWHLKLPAGPGARTEIRLPLDAGPPDQVPVALKDLVRGAARGRELRPVARVDTDRAVRTLRTADGTALLEIADDAVTATAPDPQAAPSSGGRADASARPGPREPLTWREIEVEALPDDPERAARVLPVVVDLLIAAGARPAEAASKVGRALGRRSAPAPAPAPVTGTAGAALVSYLAGQRDRLIAADLRMREPDPDAEAPHDLRAAARRIRSALRVYRPLLLPGEQQPVASALQRLGGAISGARDLDVALARLGDVAESSPAWSPAEGTAAVAGIRRRLAEWRADSLARARRELDSPEHVQLLRDLDALIGGPPLTEAAHASPPAVLQPLLAAAWLRLRADAEAARTALTAPNDPAAAERMHRVRKDAKTVRYAAEAAAGSGGPFGEAIAAFATEVEGMQDVLGAHQDAVTALAVTDRLSEDRGVDPAERLLLGHWSAAESERRSDTRAEFGHLWRSMPVLPPAPGQ